MNILAQIEGGARMIDSASASGAKAASPVGPRHVDRMVERRSAIRIGAQAMHGGCDSHDKYCELSAECLRIKAALKIATQRLGGRMIINSDDMAESCYYALVIRECSEGQEVIARERYPK